ncbi:TetR/AcrR family transcriptional regulator [Paenibacillus sp. GCM10023252]|uniref:TetR/AcrR family transcriptional regulator n=1 Tax=Paenibacillus sp. GCM10023252 TaxID=3252649 RepID=UPI00360EC6ED
MPKIVDHEKQKTLVAEAALRVIRRDGLEQASVRKIAVESGLSVGSMRHYFSSQAELFAFVMNLFLEQIEERLSRMDFSGPVLPAVNLLLQQFLPMDEERKLEMEVWLSFTTRALLAPELKGLSADMQDGLYRAANSAVDLLVKSELALPQLDHAFETERLYALIDGMALHHLMNAEKLPPERMKELLERHLSSLCRADIRP